MATCSSWRTRKMSTSGNTSPRTSWLLQNCLITVGFFCGTRLLFPRGRHQFFYVFRLRGQRGAQLDQLSIGVDPVVVLDAHPEIFFGNINARLDGEYLAWPEPSLGVGGVVHVEPDGMSQAVDEVFVQGLAVKIFAVGFDVIASDFIQRVIAAIALHGRLARLESRFGGLLCAENNVVYFALAIGEVAVDRKGARDVGSIHRILARSVDDNDVAGLHYFVVIGIVQHGGEISRTHDGSVGGALAAALAPLVLHERGDFA